MTGPFDTKNSQNGGSQVEPRLDGVHQNADVWLNGVHLGFHPYGYTAFTHDLTPHLNPTGPNVLAVPVDNSAQNSRCYSGSGIYRHTWLTVTGPVRIPLWGVHVTTPEVSERRSVAHVEVSVANLGARGPPRRTYESRSSTRTGTSWPRDTRPHGVSDRAPRPTRRSTSRSSGPHCGPPTLMRGQVVDTVTVGFAVALDRSEEHRMVGAGPDQRGAAGSQPPPAW
ncbi:sugar-binding domain-containing protein [Streptomyces mirabilis]|uniref:sugar-binding domain-containing protein n=1 Tax=Streptomyces mirabilis TaxID=68239 RepID=UPI00364C7D76